MGQMKVWFKGMSVVQKIASTVVSLAAVGGVLIAIIAGVAPMATLPDSVQALEVKVDQNTEAIHQIVDEHEAERYLMLRMLCNQDPTQTWESCERQYGGVGGGGAR